MADYADRIDELGAGVEGEIREPGHVYDRGGFKEYTPETAMDMLSTIDLQTRRKQRPREIDYISQLNRVHVCMVRHGKWEPAKGSPGDMILLHAGIAAFSHSGLLPVYIGKSYKLFELCGSGLLKTGKQVAVAVQRDGHEGMSEALGDDLRI